MKPFLLLVALSAPLLCQCQSGRAPDFVRHPNQTSARHQTDPDQILVFGHAPAVYREIGPVSVKPSLGQNWKRALTALKKQAAAMGADAIVVSQLGTYDRAATTEAYLGEEGAFTPGASHQQLKMHSRVHGMAIQIPNP